MRNLHIVLIFTGFLLTSTAGFAQADLNITEIPAALLVNANAVVRNAVTNIEIRNEGKAIITNQYVVTVFNPGGNKYASMDLQYDKLISIRSFSGNLYDASGKRIRSLKKGDITDQSATSSYSLADDNRVRSHNFNYQNYPYTVEYETAVEYNGIFYFPSWTPVEDENLSVQQSQLQVQMPLNYTIRYKTFNYNKEPEIATGKDSKTLQWKVENLVPVKSEAFSVPWFECTPSVFLAPTSFRLQDYNGTMTDWATFGKFLYTLNAGRDKLPDNVKSKVHALTDGLASTPAKVKILYEYLQQNTRYISVQLGIGGWQTYDANYVASNGYGDCKALSNYMYSLLKEAGIKSYYTLIKAGEHNQSFIPDFPSNQFNHVIVCVPQDKDTIWLECTSQTEAPGYLGSFTGNRNALIIKEDGGVLVKTPGYTKTENLQIRKINSVLDLEGNLTLNIDTKYQAEQQDDVDGLLHGLSKELIAEYLKDKLSIPSYDILKFDYTQNKNGLPSVNEKLEVKAYNFATVTGKRIFITPNILNRSGTKIQDHDKRINPIRLSIEYTDIDTVEIKVPEGYVPESLPAGEGFDTKFGKFGTSFSFEPGRIIYIRHMQRNSGYYPATDGDALKKFYDAIYRSDRARIVLVKKE